MKLQKKSYSIIFTILISCILVLVINNIFQINKPVIAQSLRPSNLDCVFLPLQAITRKTHHTYFLNRLKKGMRLESDPTVIYGIKGFGGNLKKKHLSERTPYNTYVIRGLPPGPIANPGRAAIEAVLYPADTDYLYFVSNIKSQS